MPRSGTTLVEQIISSHNEVCGAGELSYMEDIIKNLVNYKAQEDIGTDPAVTPTIAPEIQPAEVGAEATQGTEDVA